MTESQGNGRLAALVFGAVILAAVFSWWMSLAPRPLPADAPATEFSAYRAIKHIEAMAVEPHPGGSHAIEEVYAYIEGQLAAMDVETLVERPNLRQGRGNTVEKSGAVLVRIPGTASTGALGVDAHFDSTPYGPGAADDLSGVAAMLETIRALKASPPLRNDILFCFADKEEMGGDGGPGIFIRHPWFKDVRAVLGLETRGTSGPALMFETGEENGFLIRQMAQSEARPCATSIMFDFYDRMPFGSDFTRYKRLGLPGYNVAYIDSFCNYHTKLDTPANVSLASLQHHGYYTLGLARQLGSVSLENCKAPDATYFNTIGSHMVVYPRSWGWPLAYAVWALLAAVLVVGLVMRRLSVGGILAVMLVYLSSAVVALALTVPLAFLTYLVFREHALYRNNTFSAALVFIAFGILLLMARLLRGRTRPQNLLAGVLVWWALLLLLLQRYVPGGAYAATWPLAFLSLGLFALLFARDRERPSDALLAGAAASALPGIVLLTPAFVMFTYTLTAVAVPGFLWLMMLVAATLLPQMALIPQRKHTAIGAGLIVFGAILFLLACVTNTPSPDRPRQNSLSYGVNFDAGEAWWISGDKKLDAWTRNFFRDDTPFVSVGDLTGHGDTYAYLRAPAPMPPFGKTVMNKLEDRVENGRRKLKFFVDSPRDAQRIDLHLQSNVQVFSAKALGIDIEGGKEHWGVSFDTPPFEGGELELEVEPEKPLEFLAREVSLKLPEFSEADLPPRPDDMMCEPNRVLDRRRDLRSNHTFSICTFTF